MVSIGIFPNLVNVAQLPLIWWFPSDEMSRSRLLWSCLRDESGRRYLLFYWFDINSGNFVICELRRTGAGACSA